MATAYVTEFSWRGGPALAEEPCIRTQVVSFTTSTQVTLPFTENTGSVRIIAKEACHVKFGDDPTATTSDEYLAAGQEAWRIVQRRTGTQWPKVAFVAAA